MCRGLLHEYGGAAYKDGIRFVCTSCSKSCTIRIHSIFSDSTLELYTLMQLVCYFDARILVHQIEQLTGHAHSTISKFYTTIRKRIHTYMTIHPIILTDDEIVEIDELYLKPLRGEMNEFEEREA